MAGRIKGITVEIGGDTTKLEQSLKSVNSTIKGTQAQLKDVNKLLKLDPSNTELLSQKQRSLKEAIGATKEKLDALKVAQEQAKQQLEDGTLGQDKYDALQREIKIEACLDRMTVETRTRLVKERQPKFGVHRSIGIASVWRDVGRTSGRRIHTGTRLRDRAFWFLMMRSFYNPPLSDEK